MRKFIDGRAEMRRLCGQGLGTKLKIVESLTNDDEDVLWQKGALGDHTPQCLLETLIFYIGMDLALRSGDEHSRLRFHPCQIEAKQDENGQQYLLYTEDVSKNHRGGLVNRNVKPKQDVAIANINFPKRCVLRLFLKYISKRPERAPDTAFYLQPLSKYDNSVWYSRKPQQDCLCCSEEAVCSSWCGRLQDKPLSQKDSCNETLSSRVQ